MEKEWKLGYDIGPKSNMLDAITFDDVIMAVRYNTWNYTKTAVLKTAREILETRLQDFEFLLENNVDEILASAKGE